MQKLWSLFLYSINTMLSFDLQSVSSVLVKVITWNNQTLKPSVTSKALKSFESWCQPQSSALLSCHASAKTAITSSFFFFGGGGVRVILDCKSLFQIKVSHVQSILVDCSNSNKTLSLTSGSFCSQNCFTARIAMMTRHKMTFKDFKKKLNRSL